MRKRIIENVMTIIMITKTCFSIYKVLVSVRSKHCAAAKKAVTNGSCFISQKDLVLTQFGFMGLAVLKRTYLGIVGSTEDIEGFIHFWRTIGYLIGIEDRYGIFINLYEYKFFLIIVKNELFFVISYQHFVYFIFHFTL